MPRFNIIAACLVGYCIAFSFSSSNNSAAQATLPRIPQDFFTDIIQTEAQNTGYFYTNEKDGSVCCPTSLQNQPYECKLETQYLVGEISQQGSKNRTRQSNVVVWYDNVMKEILLKPASSSSKYAWECNSYCPIGKDGKFSSLTSIGDCGPEPVQCTGKNAPSNKGRENVAHARPYNNDTLLCTDIEWTETLLGLPVSQNSMYVTVEEKPKPFLFVSKLEPGGKQVQAIQNLSFINFKEIDFDKDGDKTFDIDPDSIKKCSLNPRCDEAGNNGKRSITINNMNVLLGEGLDQKKLFSPLKNGSENIHQNSRRSKHSIVGKYQPPNISFPLDWQSLIVFEEIVNKGGNIQKKSGDICCLYDTPACVVGYSQHSEYQYYDYTNKRLRIEKIGLDETNIIDYKTEKNLNVRSLNGVETCINYCPVAIGDRTMHPNPIDFDYKPVKDLGKATWHGKIVEKYLWYDSFPILNHSIPMQTYTLFVDESDKQHAVPLEQYSDVTPLNSTRVSRIRKTWTKFVPGAIDPNKFKIAKVDTCPKAPSC